MNASDIIDEILRREGSIFTNKPADRGGATKFGITQKTLGAYRGRPATVEDVMRLTEPEARSIYFMVYVRGPGFNRIEDADLMGLVIDCAVNHGQNRTTKWIQKIVGVQEDGILGPVTADAINKHDPAVLYKKLLARRVRFYGEIINEDWKRAMDIAHKTPGLSDDMALSRLQAMFAEGWCDRAAEFIEA